MENEFTAGVLVYQPKQIQIMIKVVFKRS